MERLGSLQLVMNPQTKKMEPAAEQERTVLEVVQTVKAVQESRMQTQAQGWEKI